MRRLEGRRGFRVKTSQNPLEALNVVAATGALQRRVMTGLVPDGAGVVKMHLRGYRNPDQLPPGAVLVVGSGSSGEQVAEELLHAGRRVHLAVGLHGRPPRSCCGRDLVW